MESPSTKQDTASALDTGTTADILPELPTLDEAPTTHHLRSDLLLLLFGVQSSEPGS